MFKKEIRLSGSGGQGIILAAVILADAAIKAGFHAIQTQSYGPEARGGASRAEVIISDAPVYYPKVTSPHIFLALTAESYRKYCTDISDDGLILLDQSIDVQACPAGVIRVPVLETARASGREITANMVALGALSALLEPMLPARFIETAISERVPSGTADINLAAFQNGYAMIQSNNRLRGGNSERINQQTI
jgi:2-oxoglutarate ferredoxin oxidoreductase subunit gamma